MNTVTNKISPDSQITLSLEDAELLVNKIQSLENTLRDLIEILGGDQVDNFVASDMLKNLSTHDLEGWLRRKISG